MTAIDISLQWMIAAVVGAAMYARGRLTPYHPCAIYLAFHLIAFCVRPTLVYFAGFDAVFQQIGFTPDAEYLRQGLLISSAGLVLLFFAYSWATAGAPRIEREEVTEIAREDRQAFYMTALVFVPIGLYPIAASLVGITHVGGGGAVEALHLVFVPVSVLLLLVSRWKAWAFVPYALYLAYQLHEGTSRAVVLASFFLLVLLWLWDHRRRTPSILLILPVPVLLLLVLNMGLDRDYVNRVFRGESPIARTVFDSTLSAGERLDGTDFAGFDAVAAVAAVVPGKTGRYDYGTHYLQLLTAPIPKALWKGKPEGSPLELVKLADHGDFRGVPLPIVAHGWIAGGWIGLSLTMLGLGGLLGWAYRWFVQHPASIHRACAFLLLDSFIIAFFRDGSAPIILTLVVCLVPIVFWAILSGRIRRVSAAVDEDEAKVTV